MKLKHYIKKINDKKSSETWLLMSTMKQKTMGDEVVSGNGKKDKIKFKDKFIKITLLTYYMFSGHIVYVFM